MSTTYRISKSGSETVLEEYVEDDEDSGWYTMATLHEPSGARRMRELLEELERLKQALPDPDRLELLADWLDVDDANKVRPETVTDEHPDEVQRDLRRWAKQARAALASEECHDGCSCCAVLNELASEEDKEEPRQSDQSNQSDPKP